MKRDADLGPQRLRRKKYANVSLLIIDEVGFEPMTRQEASLFFRQGSHRYGRGSLLITTNKGIKDRPEVLATANMWRGQPSSLASESIPSILSNSRRA